MKNSRITWLAAASALVLGAALPGVASAQSTWNLISGGGCTQNATNSGNFGNSWGCTGSGNAGTTATARAYSTQWGETTAWTQNINTGTQYANAFMSAQGNSGFGAANRNEGVSVGSPDHAVDNNPTGSYDMIVLNFNTSVVLSQIGVGWTSNSSGADISVLRWTGSGDPTATSATIDAGSGGTGALLRSGWTLVSSLADVIGDSTSPYGGNARNTFAGAGASSSWWMIAAFNTTLNGTSCYSNNSGSTIAENTYAGKDSYNNPIYKCDDGDDAFKLNWLKTSLPTQTQGVPEPGSVALLAAALLAAGAARRRAMSRR